MLEYGKALHNIFQCHRVEHFCWGGFKEQKTRESTKNNPNDIKVNIRDVFETIPDNVTEEDF